MLILHNIGEDYTASINWAINYARGMYRHLEVTRVHLHPLDKQLDKYPYGWPEVVYDEETPRHKVLVELVDPRPTEGQMALPLRI